MTRSRKLIAAAALTLLAFAALEGGARLLPSTLTDELHLDIPPGSDGIPMLASTEVPGWDLPPAQGNMGDIPYTVNHWHMRGPEAADAKPAGTVRVIFVGDSSIFGYMLPWEQTMDAQLETLREARAGRDLEVASCAAPGHSTEQSRRKLTAHCLAFQPDVVIIGNLNSDATFDEMSDKDRFHLATSVLAEPLHSLALYRLMRNTLLKARYPHMDEAPPQAIAQRNDPAGPRGTARRVPPKDYSRNLHRMIDQVREAGAIPILLLLPQQADANGGENGGDEEYPNRMREVAAEEGVPLADGPRAVREEGGDTSLFLDAVHPSAAGAALLARLLDRLWGGGPLPLDGALVMPPVGGAQPAGPPLGPPLAPGAPAGLAAPGGAIAPPTEVPRGPPLPG